MLRRVATLEAEATVLVESAAIPVLDVGAGRYIKSLLRSGGG